MNEILNSLFFYRYQRCSRSMVTHFGLLILQTHNNAAVFICVDVMNNIPIFTHIFLNCLNMFLLFYMTLSNAKYITLCDKMIAFNVCCMFFEKTLRFVNKL